MILILLALLVSVTALPDYYAVGFGENYKIFTKISECTGAVYQSGHNRVLFQDGVWKIGTLRTDLDCNTLSSVVAEEFRTKSPAERPELTLWYDMRGGDQKTWIFFKHLNKRGKKTGVKLVGGTMLLDKSEEDCFTEDWGTRFPDKDIVVAFQDSNCFYDFVDRAQLAFSSRFRSATVFVHPAGKNILVHTYK